MYNKTITEFGFRMISWIIKTPCLCYLPKPIDLGFDNSWYHAPSHPIIVYYSIYLNLNLYLPSNVLFTCSTLTSEYWLSKLALQLNGAKVNQSPNKCALLTYFFSCYKTHFPNTYLPSNITSCSNGEFTRTTVLCITPPGTAQVPSQIGFLKWRRHLSWVKTPWLRIETT